MTREEAKQLLPIIQAFVEGKTIECKRKSSLLDSWTEAKSPSWSGALEYRIKSEPKYRPFKTQEECWNEMLKHQPFSSLKSKDDEYFCLIGSVNKDNTITLAIEPNTYYAYHYIFEHYIFSDGTPFGIKEEQI